jgi:hypothetical protein
VPACEWAVNSTDHPISTIMDIDRIINQSANIGDNLLPPSLSQNIRRITCHEMLIEKSLLREEF